MSVLWASLLVALLAICWVLTLLGLPGNWLMVAITAAYSYLIPSDQRTAIGWQVIVALLVLAIAGELVELLAGGAAVAKLGGKRRSVVLALIGSLAGGIVGLVLGLPIPLVGSVVASLLFASLGAFIGAVIGEMHSGRDVAGSWQVGQAAFRGRLLGTLAKSLIGLVMILVAVGALVF